MRITMRRSNKKQMETKTCLSSAFLYVFISSLKFVWSIFLFYVMIVWGTNKIAKISISVYNNIVCIAKLYMF